MLVSTTDDEEYELHRVVLSEDDFEATLEQAMPLLLRVVPVITNKYTDKEIEKKIRQQQGMLFVVWHGNEMVSACLVTYYKHRAGLGMNIEIASGEGEHYGKIVDTFVLDIENHVQEITPVSFARITGRPAIWRMVKSWGYDPTHFFAEKRLR